MALPITLKNILTQKKNYENSNISPCKNIIIKKIPLKETKILQDIITLELMSSFKSSQNIIFQKSFKLLGILYNESKHNILALVGKANKAPNKGRKKKKRNKEKRLKSKPERQNPK